MSAGDITHRHRPDLRHLCLPALSAGAADRDSGSGVTRGRIGWNAVTGSSDFAAMNFRPARHAGARPALRHGRRIHGGVPALWASWEPGAIIADRHSGVLVDHTKVHAVNLEGRFYKTRGPLNSGTLPARSTGDRTGRRLAARTTIRVALRRHHRRAHQGHRRHEGLSRRCPRAHGGACGRDPDACKVLFLVAPIIGETDAEAQEKKRARAARAAAQIPQRLAHLGKVTNIDFGRFDLDKPLPADVTTNGHQQTLDEFRAKAAGTDAARDDVATTTRPNCRSNWSARRIPSPRAWAR